MNKEEKKFFGWMWALKLFAVKGFKFKETTVFSPQHWKVYYDDGLNVVQALQEDFKA